MASPTLMVLLDDGTGTFPFDISSKVLGNDGYSITRGRDDWIGAVTAGELNLTLNNSDGRFTPGSTILATPSPIKVDQRIRLIVTDGVGGFGLGGFGVGGFGGGGYRFTGYVKSWPVAWPAVVPTFSTVSITATDAQARAERRDLRAMGDEEVIANGAAALYTLGELVGATSAGNTSGSSEPSLTLVGVDQTGFSMGNDLGLPDGQTGATFTGHGVDSVGGRSAFLRQTTDGAFSSSSINYTFVVVCATGADATPNDWVPVSMGGGPSVPTIDTAGKVNFGAGISPASVCDGLPHVVTVQGGGGSATDIFIDGAKVATAANISGTWQTSGFPSRFSISGNTKDGVTSTIGEVSYGSRVTDAEVVNAHRAIMGTHAETADSRITRLAGYAGIPTGTLDVSTTTVPFQSTAGATAFAAIQDVTDADMGVTFVDGSGNLTFHNRDEVRTKTAPDLILDAQYVTPDVTPTHDDERLVNYMEVTAQGTGTLQLVRDTTSETTHGRYPNSRTYLVQTDQEALDRANWIVGKLAEPTTRYGTLTINLYKMTVAQASIVLAALEVDCWLRVTSAPSQNPGGTVADVVVQGWQENASNDSWVITCNVVSRSIFTAGIWDDSGSKWDFAVWGV